MRLIRVFENTLHGAQSSVKLLASISHVGYHGRMKQKSPKTDDAAATALRKSGLRATPARRVVLALMDAARRPVTAQELIAKAHTGIHEATIYRIIHDLVSRGVIRQVDLRHNHAHYERADARDHHHLVCMRCGRIQDITGCDVEDMYARILRAADWCAEVRQHALEFYGVCKRCPSGRKIQAYSAVT